MKIKGHEFEKEKGRVYRRFGGRKQKGKMMYIKTNKHLVPFKYTLRTNSD